MSRNPYLDQPNEPPKQAYELTLRNTGEKFQVDPANLPDDETDGLEGSVLALLLANGVDINHSCGGVVGCSTCHIYVHSGLDTSPEPIDEEEDRLILLPLYKTTLVWPVVLFLMVLKMSRFETGMES